MERRVYKLDILERDIEESVLRLTKYLSYNDVCSGKSLKDAQADYVATFRVREVKDTLPLAWRKLIEEQDDLLIELIADKVEDLCGYKPEPDSVEDLYPGRPDMRKLSHKFESGWWIGTNISNSRKEHILKMGCDVAGLCFGKDLLVNFGD